MTSRRRQRAAAAAIATLVLAACATARPPPPPTGPPPSAPAETPVRPQAPAPPAPRVLPLAALPGWSADDHAAAFQAFRRACGLSRDAAAAAVCRAARAQGQLDEPRARAFLEARFAAERVTEAEGLLTAYFAPEYAARRAPDAEFSAPVRPKPADPAALYAGRAAIEAAPAADALAWMRPEDLFFLQVQGSGVLAFADGGRAKALYAGTNGQGYVAIGAPMRARGLIEGQVSAQAIHAWLAAHRGPEADAIMRLNPRYGFFRLATADGRAPAGSANVPLPAGRALAVDPAFHPMGELLWVDADKPALAGAKPYYRRLAVALDSGAAIRGPVRADLYLGEGPAAGEEAGLVHHALRLYRLVPR